MDLQTQRSRVSGLTYWLNCSLPLAGGLAAALLLFSPSAHSQTQNICERYGALDDRRYYRGSGQRSPCYDGQICDRSNKGITSLSPGDFDGLPNLVTILLERNALTSLPESVFDGLSNVREIRVNRNNLTSPPEGILGIFDGLSNLAIITM
ncbi:MAG TPA: leucine-rich repeat domain-containing protein [Synechococcus sp. UBA8638]|uniref:leucine-rich repeat domain-containing protein n=1 Tax=Candidatus Synechococcus spongiarum TaxID=431041 RepID=UPI0009071A41|nr:leucine-rich repeat domain-containing protein [Synechococcus sp. UBA8638]